MSQTDSDTTYLRTLLELGRTLNSSLDLDHVLHIAIEQVVDFVRAERGFILLVDEKSKRVEGKAVHNIDPFSLESALRGRDLENRPEISRTIVEQALGKRTPVVSTNAQDDPRFGSSTSVKLASVRSVLCVPLTAQGRSLGIIYLDSRVKSGVFEDIHVEMVSAFANLAAVAIENARLYDNLRRSLEEQRRIDQERSALEEANRLKSDYVGYVSHELRTPLTVIRGFVQTLLADSSVDDSQKRNHYEIIEAEADRMLALINHLLDSARLEAGRQLSLNARPIRLGPLLERMANSTRFNKYWTHKHRIETAVLPMDEVIADEEKIVQILTNLLSNAVKYSPDGGLIRIAGEQDEKSVKITVSDEGVGMSQEHLSRLFTKFERLERSDIARIPGTGLGLFLTKHLVELHGGTIVCNSEPGRGSRFTVTLPRTSPSYSDN